MNKKVEELVKTIPNITTADKLLPTDNDEIASRFKILCKTKKTNIEEMFIWIDDNYGKSPKEKVTNTGVKYDLRKHKLGF